METRKISILKFILTFSIILSSLSLYSQEKKLSDFLSNMHENFRIQEYSEYKPLETLIQEEGVQVFTNRDEFRNQCEVLQSQDLDITGIDYTECERIVNSNEGLCYEEGQIEDGLEIESKDLRDKLVYISETYASTFFEGQSSVLCTNYPVSYIALNFNHGEIHAVGFDAYSFLGFLGAYLTSAQIRVYGSQGLLGQYTIFSGDFFGITVSDDTILRIEVEELSGNFWEAIGNLEFGKCSANSEPGCLNSPNGMYPENVFESVCYGEEKEITNLAWTGEYSEVSVTEGTEYTFRSSVDTDLVTISSATGSEILSTGTGLATYTPNFSGIIRFYLHLNDECEFSEIKRSKFVKCGEPLPNPESCEENVSISDNFSSVITLSRRPMIDIPVSNNGYNIYGYEVNFLVLNPESNDVPQTFKTNIYENVDGTPGALIYSIDTHSGEEREYIGSNAYGDEFFQYKFKFDEPVYLNPNSTYWLSPEIDSQTIGWESQPNNKIGYRALVITELDTYVELSNAEMVYRIICDEELNTSESSFSDFSYYPNPVKDFLNISYSKEISNVSIFDSSGKQVYIGRINNKNAQINLVHLPSGVYIVKAEVDGEIKTFKIVKK